MNWFRWIAVTGVLLTVSVTTFGLVRGYQQAQQRGSGELAAALASAPATPLPSPPPKVDLPFSVQIPQLNLEAPIESVGIEPTGRMGVPQDYNQVAWFSGGARPGEYGSAVLAGHVDTPQGDPAVFSRLHELSKGDEITIRDAQGRESVFVVEESVEYADATFPVKEIFYTADGPLLRLITCSGNFDRSAANYSHRRVVTARQK